MAIVTFITNLFMSLLWYYAVYFFLKSMSVKWNPVCNSPIYFLGIISFLSCRALLKVAYFFLYLWGKIFKETVSRDFLLLVFYKFPPSPRVSHLDRFKFFGKFAEKFASQGAPPVSTTPVANLPAVSTTPAAKFAIGVVDTGDKFCHPFL